MLLVFVSIAFGGFLVLMMSLLLGGDHDVDADGDFDTDADGDMGGGHHWLSLKVLSAFATAFGASGAIARAYDVSVPWSMAIGLAAGFIIASIADFIIMLFFKQQASSSFSIQNLNGLEGIVTLTIQPNQYGEVSVHYQGNNITRRAKCSNPNESIPQGDAVIVEIADISGFIVKRRIHETS